MNFQSVHHAPIFFLNNCKINCTHVTFHNDLDSRKSLEERQWINGRYSYSSAYSGIFTIPISFICISVLFCIGQDNSNEVSICVYTLYPKRITVIIFFIRICVYYFYPDILSKGYAVCQPVTTQNVCKDDRTRWSYLVAISYLLLSLYNELTISHF